MKLLHGGDYNAEQWLDRPDILEEDIRLMKKAGVNVVTLGVFSWASLEPREGFFTFEWLDRIMDSMYENGIYVILATPSAGKPPWLVKKYPDTMRTTNLRMRRLYGERENQCNSSLIFRKKVREIDEKLGERYGNHPALILWHISNEIYGECHCENCQIQFRDWLKRKYGTLDQLNREYWSTFWSHTYQEWEELESPSPAGERAIHGLALDYKRFYSDLSIDFVKKEIEAVHKYYPQVPVTTNFWHFNCGVNYAKLAKELDVVAWDSYPEWHRGNEKGSEWDIAVHTAFGYDVCRSYKKRPFMLMETTPSITNWTQVCKLKRPGMHMLGAMQAIACGSDTVQYFQWRQSRGAAEKFHGAVLTHNGSSDTRVFREVAEVGQRLRKLEKAARTETKSRAAVIFDWDNILALYEQNSLRMENQKFESIVEEHYEALLKNYVSVDVIAQDADFTDYRVITAPMLYLFLPGTPEKIRRFVEEGGTFVMTYFSGLVNENDLAFEGFSPYDLNDVFGIRSEEIDSLPEEEGNFLIYLGESYEVREYCDLVQLCGAETLASYGADFYAGLPALTRHDWKKGRAYYMAGRGDAGFLYRFYKDILEEAGVVKLTDSAYVKDVMVREREGNGKKYKFFMNFSEKGRSIEGEHLDGYEVKIRELDAEG